MNMTKTLILTATAIFIPAFIMKKLYAKHETGYIEDQHPADAIIESLKQSAILGREAADRTMQMRLSNERAT